MRGRAEVKRAPVLDKPVAPVRVTAEAAADIMALAGFAAKRMDGPQNACHMAPDRQD